MAIFNSLGSNFTVKTARSRALAPRGIKAADAMKADLQHYYGGSCTLTFKGRQALQLALMRAGLQPGSEVVVNGFTCFVVAEAVLKAGCTPFYLDISENDLHFNAAQLESALKNEPNIKAVIVQNTFGVPCDIVGIKATCKRNNLLLIEDLAHSIGALYSDGTEAGMVGDFVMLSFSQDKTLDVVAGGALIDRFTATRQTSNQSTGPETRRSIAETFKQIHNLTKLKNRLYPLLTVTVRKTFTSGFGRALLKVLRMGKLLSRPMDKIGDGVNIYDFDSSGAPLLLLRWARRGTEYTHRQRIAQIYRESLPMSLQTNTQVGTPVMVRFPIMVDDRANMMQYLARHGYYFSDTWYDAPVGPKSYFAKSGMSIEQFPAAHAASRRVVNLPTHSQITEADARRICATIGQWLTTASSK